MKPSRTKDLIRPRRAGCPAHPTTGLRPGGRLPESRIRRPSQSHAMRTLPIVAALLALLPCCGSGGGGSPGDVAGIWIGDWASSNGVNGGQMGLTLTQTESTLDGTASFFSSPCFSGGTVSDGDVSGWNVSGSLISGSARVDFTGTVSGTSHDVLSGAYEVVSAGFCTGDTGTISLTRFSPLLADPEPTRRPVKILRVYTIPDLELVQEIAVLR